VNTYKHFVQLCTDKEGSASDMYVASKRSSASSIATKHEMIALQWKQTELVLSSNERKQKLREAGRMLNFDDESSKFKWSKHGRLLRWS